MNIDREIPEDAARDDDTDTKLIDYLESRSVVVITDDIGNWAVVTPGLQAIPEAPGHDVDVTVNISHGAWRKSLREAIVAHREDDTL